MQNTISLISIPNCAVTGNFLKKMRFSLNGKLPLGENAEKLYAFSFL
jgi:hypothetical protein